MSVTEALLKSELDLAWQHIFKRDTSAAMAHAKKASTIANESPDVAHVLGVIASRDGRPDLALPLLQKALSGGITERKLRDMTEALMYAKQPQAALAPIKDCIKQFGASFESLGLLAAVYVALERFDEASRSAHEALSLKPDTFVWQTTIAFCDLIQGSISSGFKAFTFRSHTTTEGGRCPTLHFTTPGDLWLKNEQGPGDTLFYLRHAPALVSIGWKLHVQSHPTTQKLLEETGLFSEVSLTFNCPKDGFWINIGDLPLAATQLSLPTLSAPLPLKAQKKSLDKLAKLLIRFGPPPYIAVTWRGGVQGSKVRNGIRMGDRYIDAYNLGDSLKEVNATVISIQRVPNVKEAKAFEAGLGRKFLDLSRLNNNLQEMLALLDLVDDYIGVSNTNFHLRQALGKPSKIVINRPYEDWRWSHEGNSPWYPNATCYRQVHNGNLDEVLKKINADLLSTFGSSANRNAQFENSQLEVFIEHVEPIDESQDAKIKEILNGGWLAVGANDVPKAIKHAQQVITISPDNPGAYHLLGWAAMRDLKIDLAVSVLKRATELDSTDGRIIGDYVRSITASKQHALAIEVATNALNNPATNNRSSIYYGRAACYLNSQRLEEAIEDYQSCMTVNPNRLDAQEYSGMARLKLGQAIKGFRELTARKVAQRDELLNDWCCPTLTLHHKGSRILIKRDMGLGDELTYLRYLPWLTAAGMQVDYWSGKKLVPVLARMGYLNQVYPDSQIAPESTGYDLSLIVNDLPVAAHGLGAPEIAPPLPLSPRPDLVEKWQAWLQSVGNGPYIGLNWKAGMGVQGAGNIFSKLAKAVDTETFAKALSSIGATWISLQRNVLKEELDQFQQHLQAPLHDAASLTDDIEDLLALLSLLDENVGVSNTNMHLRASLGLGSRVMVQTPGGDWRWGIEGDSSVWFTESKVYRQSMNGEWDAPLQVLQDDLKAKYGQRDNTNNSSELSKIVTLSHANSSQTKRLIWVTAGAIKIVNDKQISELASARYRVIAPSVGLAELGWQSEIVNEELSQVMGGWGSAVPKVGDTLIVSKVFGEHALKLASDAKSRGANIIVDFCDNFLEHPKRGALQHSLLKMADKVIASTEVMAHAIKKHGYQVDAVISDPVEMQHGEPKFEPNKTLQILWFGHAVNLDTLKSFLPSLAEYSSEQPLHLSVVTTLPNGKSDLNNITPAGLSVTYVPWSADATQKAITNCDIVIIPVLESQFKSAKSPNRLLETLWAGRMVVAGPLPAYLPFADSAWVGKDLIDGIRWSLMNPGVVKERILQGQVDIATHFTQKAIAQSWANILSVSATRNTVAHFYKDLKPSRLNLGCGDKILDGYINVDVVESRSGKKPDLLCDLRHLKPFADNSVDEILSVHVVEHFWRWEVLDILKEWVRVLKPGGKMVLECPNLKSACEEFLKNPEAAAFGGPEGQRSMWVFYGDPRWKDPYMVHRWGYTPESLAKLMSEAGLIDAHQEPAEYKLREPRDMRVVAMKPVQ
jgi:tetratricopeptide (TPR) repeat protein/SAM-dependent methyltransferase